MSGDAKVCILNDTSEWYHWGCHGTSLGLRRLVNQHFMPDTIAIVPITMTYAPSHLPAAPSAMDSLRDAEAFLRSWPAAQALVEASDIVINGEGTLHGLTSHVKRLLFIVALCGKVLNKRVHLVNHSVFLPEQPDEVAWYRAAYESAHQVAVRESESARTIQTQFGRQVRLAFDCLPVSLESLVPEPAAPGADYAIITGTSGLDVDTLRILQSAVGHLKAQGLRVIWLLGAPKKPAYDEGGQAALCAPQLDVEVVTATSFAEWAGLIRDAAFVFTGRFHYVIARLCLGGPFTAFGGNTPKIDAMLRDLKLPGLVAGREADAVPTIGVANRLALPPRVTDLAERARLNLL
jgi:hypothetical protein